MIPLLWMLDNRRTSADLPCSAREESEQREHNDDDQDDPKNAHEVTPFTNVIG
jgi:hypothetical protein